MLNKIMPATAEGSWSAVMKVKTKILLTQTAETGGKNYSRWKVWKLQHTLPATSWLQSSQVNSGKEGSWKLRASLSFELKEAVQICCFFFTDFVNTFQVVWLRVVNSDTHVVNCAPQIDLSIGYKLPALYAETPTATSHRELPVSNNYIRFRHLEV